MMDSHHCKYKQTSVMWSIHVAPISCILYNVQRLPTFNKVINSCFFCFEFNSNCTYPCRQLHIQQYIIIRVYGISFLHHHQFKQRATLVQKIWQHIQTRCISCETNRCSFLYLHHIFHVTLLILCKENIYHSVRNCPPWQCRNIYLPSAITATWDLWISSEKQYVSVSNILLGYQYQKWSLLMLWL